jgi:hypothetical protein
MVDPASLYWPLTFVHVLAFAYWLGGDIGVYVTGGYVARADLPLAERLRFLDALLAIDMMPRTGIVLLPVLGVQIAALRGAIATPPWLQVVFWVGGLAWLALVWSVFRTRGTPLGLRLQRIDVGFRWLLIPVLVFIGAWSLWGAGPVQERWLATKLISYATLLALGLALRGVLKGWGRGFALLRAGQVEEGERLIATGNIRGKRIAWVFWAIIAFTAWLGVAKPF